jgi:hypothetical protein
MASKKVSQKPVLGASNSKVPPPPPAIIDGMFSTIARQPLAELFFLLSGAYLANYCLPGFEMIVWVAALIMTLYCYDVCDVLAWLIRRLNNWVICGVFYHVFVIIYVIIHQKRQSDPTWNLSEPAL